MTREYFPSVHLMESADKDVTDIPSDPLEIGDDEREATISVGVYESSGEGVRVEIIRADKTPQVIAESLIKAVRGIGQVRGLDTLVAIQSELDRFGDEP